MTTGAVNITLVFVNTQIEFIFPFNYGFVKRGKQHMPVTIEIFNGSNKQTVIFSGIAIYHCSGTSRNRHGYFL